MEVLTFPSITPTAANFGLTSNTQVFTSPLAKTVQTLENPGAHWKLSAQFDNLTYAETRTIKSFLAQCRGQGGRFYYGDPAYLLNGPAGVATGTPTVNGASQTGNSLITAGWTASQTGIVKAGDYIQFDNSTGGRELHMVVADVNSDGAGAATLTIEPAIRVAPNNAAAITIAGAKAQFRLSDDDSAWSGRAPLIGAVSFSAVEAFTDAA